MKKTVCWIAISLAVAGCKITETPLPGSVRAEEGGVLAREGLAFSRILTSPVQLPLTYAGLYSYYYEDGKPVRIGHTDPFSKGVSSLLHGSLAGPICICEEICVGLVEMLSTVQFRTVIYPWETYGFYSRAWNLEKDLEYVNSPEMLEKRRRARERLERQAAEVAAVAVEVAGESLDAAVEESIDRAVSRHVRPSKGRKAPGTAQTGFATIKGANSIAVGKTERYQLYVGGKHVDCEWAGGTSITVSQSGRVLAGNPPIKSGKYRTTLKARYNGKEYTKSIYIVK